MIKNLEVGQELTIGDFKVKIQVQKRVDNYNQSYDTYYANIIDYTGDSSIVLQCKNSASQKIPFNFSMFLGLGIENPNNYVSDLLGYPTPRGGFPEVNSLEDLAMVLQVLDNLYAGRPKMSDLVPLEASAGIIKSW